MSFTHLRAASGYSPRYGAGHPHAPAERAAGRGLDALALTGRDFLAGAVRCGAVRFAKACAGVGIRPLFGVDLAVPGVPEVGPASAKRRRTTPSRGGVFVTKAPRCAAFPAWTAPGWAELRRPVSAASDQGVTWEGLSCPDGDLRPRCRPPVAAPFVGLPARGGRRWIGAPVPAPRRVSPARSRCAVTGGRLRATTRSVGRNRSIELLCELIGCSVLIAGRQTSRGCQSRFGGARWVFSRISTSLPGSPPATAPPIRRTWCAGRRSSAWARSR
ncbi:PHP domain-containing protein [Streptomyces sp. NPDC048445]|uniref:PHP domain-containing protein n=1 Tax=Streptomyces sp. NPDC048445 TaxID=3365553 RepID=UPI00371807F7